MNQQNPFSFLFFSFHIAKEGEGWGYLTYVEWPREKYVPTAADDLPETISLRVMRSIACPHRKYSQFSVFLFVDGRGDEYSIPKCGLRPRHV